MSETPFDPSDHRSGERERLELLFAEYVERLNTGERIDPREIIEKHSELAADLLRELDVYESLQSGDVPSKPHGPLGTLGDYTLRRQIGRGGMGVVYEAWQNSMDRRVALKVLPAGIAADSKACARFMREAQTAGKLSHRNIVGVHSTGIEEGTPWYSMEYVKGETLAQLLGEFKDADSDTETVFGRKDTVVFFGRIAEAFAVVADGLQHAHSKGVIHRDIKPSNLILDGEGKLRILDFGLARLEGHESLSRSGDLIGTVLYMSPEQAMAKRIPLDHRTDVYSLGATMYEALTGEPPFRGRNHHDTLSQIIVRDPRSPRQLNPGIPADLETISLKCLRKDPADRYGTAEALAQDLRRFVRGAPIEARPQSGLERLVSRVRRHRTRLAVGGVFLVLVAVMGWFAHQRELAEDRTQAARLEAKKAKLATFELRVREVLKEIYSGWYSLQVSEGQREDLFFKTSGTRSLARLTPEEINALRRNDGLHPVEEAARHLEEIADEVAKPAPHYHLAKALKLLGFEEEARSQLRKALERDPRFVPAKVFLSELDEADADGSDFETVRPDDHRPCDWTGAWLAADASVKRKDWSRAAEAYGELIALWAQGREPYVGSAIEAHIGRGMAYLELEKYDRALLDFHGAYVLEPGLTEATLLMGKAHHLSGRQKEAEQTFDELYERADEKSEAALWIAGVYHSLEDYKRGLYWAEKLEPGVHVRDRLRSYFLFRSGEMEESIKAGRRAIQLNERDPVAHLLLASALSSDLASRQGLDRLGRLLELLRVASAAVALDSKSFLAQAFLARAKTQLNSFIWRQIVNTLSSTHMLSWVVPILLTFTGVEAAEIVGSTYFGGSGDDYFFRDVKVHPKTGDIIAVGSSNSPDIPQVGDALDGSPQAFVARFDSSLSQLVSATYFGNSGGEAIRFDVAPDGTVVVVGYTASDFETTDGSEHSGDRDAFVARVDTSPDVPESERLLYASILGGQNEDSFVDVHVDSEGVVTAMGYTGSPEFPVTEGAFQEEYGGGAYDVVLVQLRPSGDHGYERAYSTFVGGTGPDTFPEDYEVEESKGVFRILFSSMVVDEKGLVTMTGLTRSRDFPTTEGAYDRIHNGGNDTYIVQIDPELGPEDQLRYSTFLGGALNDDPLGLALLDEAGTVVVTGITFSRDFPTTPGAHDRAYDPGGSDTFLSIIRPDLPPQDQLLQSTYFGGPDWEDVQGVTVDARGRIYLIGESLPDVAPREFPVTPDAFQAEPRGFRDTFLSVFELDSDFREIRVVYSTLLGGTDALWDSGGSVTLTDTGDVIIAGYTDACDFPVRNAYQPDCAGGDADGFLMRLRLDLPPLPGPEFLRGDYNADGTVNIADATCALNWLFAGAAEPPCRAAVNSNGDDKVDIADPISLLNYLFGGGPVISEPFPDCGPGLLPADKDLGCASPPDC